MVAARNTERISQVPPAQLTILYCGYAAAANRTTTRTERRLYKMRNDGKNFLSPGPSSQTPRAPFWDLVAKTAKKLNLRSMIVFGVKRILPPIPGCYDRPNGRYSSAKFSTSPVQRKTFDVGLSLRTPFFSYVRSRAKSPSLLLLSSDDEKVVQTLGAVNGPH